MQVDVVANRRMLVVGEDLGCVGDLATGHVLERLIGVETAAALSDLGDPGPHRLRRCIDGDSQGVRPLGFGHELIARKRITCLCSHRAPPQPPPPDERGGDQVPHNEGGALKRSQNAHTGGASLAISKPSDVRVPPGRHVALLDVLPAILPQRRCVSQESKVPTRTRREHTSSPETCSCRFRCHSRAGTHPEHCPAPLGPEDRHVSSARAGGPNRPRRGRPVASTRTVNGSAPARNSRSRVKSTFLEQPAPPPVGTRRDERSVRAWPHLMPDRCGSGCAASLATTVVLCDLRADRATAKDRGRKALVGAALTGTVGARIAPVGPGSVKPGEGRALGSPVGRLRCQRGRRGMDMETQRGAPRVKSGRRGGR